MEIYKVLTKLKFAGLLLLLLTGLGSCFKEDTPVPPYVWNGQSFTCPVSIYTHQLYVDLSSGMIGAQVPIGAWDLAFESAAGKHRIFVNSGNLLGISHTGKFDLGETVFPAASLHYRYDKSDGNPDSTAIGDWVTITDSVRYTGEVYLLGKYDGVEYTALQKIMFQEVTDTSYLIQYAVPGAQDGFASLVIPKDTSCSYTYFSFQDGVVKVEPAKQDWDLLLTQYMTTLYTSDSIPTPYFVRGVLLNPYQTTAVLDTNVVFESATLADAAGLAFKSDRDVIGYDWKDVKVNTQTNSAEYFVRPNYTYFIRDNAGNLFKLRFTGFYNQALETGYPSFNYLKLNE